MQYIHRLLAYKLRPKRHILQLNLYHWSCKTILQLNLYRWSCKPVLRDHYLGGTSVFFKTHSTVAGCKSNGVSSWKHSSTRVDWNLIFSQSQCWYFWLQVRTLKDFRFVENSYSPVSLPLARLVPLCPGYHVPPWSPSLLSVLRHLWIHLLLAVPGKKYSTTSFYLHPPSINLNLPL